METLEKPFKEIPYMTAYRGRHKTTSPAGSKMENEYGYEIKANGEKVLVKTGEINIYDQIQAEHENTKIESVLARVAAGDMSDFRPQGIYQDISKIPNNFIDAQKEMMKVNKLWNNLSAETRMKYNNDVNQFMAQAGTDAWLIDSGFVNPTATEVPVTLKTDEQIAKEGATNGSNNTTSTTNNN